MTRTVRSAWNGCAALVSLALLATPLPAQGPGAQKQDRIEGLLLAAESGKPLAGARVSVGRLPARHLPTEPDGGPPPPEPSVRRTSDGRGVVSLPSPGEGPLRVVVRAPGRLPLAYTLLPGAPSRRLPPVEVPKARRLRLRVLAESGDALPGATVTLLAATGDPLWRRTTADGWRPLPRRGTAGGDGGLTLAVAEGEEVWLRIAPPGLPPGRPLRLPAEAVRASLAGSDPVRVSPAPVPGAREGERETAPGETAARPMSGRLLDPAGRAVRGFVWTDTDPGAAVASEADGSFHLSAPPDARWVVAAAEGRRSRVARIADLRSQEGPVTLRLEAAAEVAGRVVDPAGSPIPWARVEAAVPDVDPDVDPDLPRRLIAERPAVTWAGADGRFRLGGLPVLERYALPVARRGFHGRRVEVAASEAGAVRVVLDPNRVAFGSILAPDEHPVAGAEVLLEPQGAPADRAPRRTLTRADGGFEIDDVEAGRWTLVARHPDHATSRVPGLRVPRPPGPVDLGTVVLGRQAVLSGSVTDPRGRAIEGAKVRLYDPLADPSEAPRAVFTDGTGGFRLQGLTPGTAVDLRVEHPDHVTARLDAIRLPPPEPLAVVLEDGLRIRGRVVDGEGAAVAKARVHLDPPAGAGPPVEGVSASDGRFELGGLRPGTYGAVARAHGHRDSARLEVVVEAETAPIELVLRDGARVLGRVLGPDGGPAVGATVQVAEPRGAVETGPRDETDAEGRYRLEGVEPGRRLLEARHPRYPPRRLQVEVAPGENHRDLLLEHGGEVSGRVVSASGAPLGGATVELAGGGPPTASATSRGDGTFRLDGVAPGIYRVEARHSGHAPARLEGVEVGPDGVAGLEVVLEPGATLAGRVLGLEPEALGRLEVRATDATRDLLRGTVDYAGRYRVDGVSPGDWWVSGELPDGRTAEAAVTVLPGEPRVTADLEFSREERLRGRVLLAGEPLADAEVTLAEAGSHPGATAFTDRDGRFTLSEAPSDGGLLRVVHPDRGVFHRQEVPPGAQEVLVDLPGARLAGRVRSAFGGGPIDGARVTAELLDASEPLPRSVRSGADGRFRFSDLQAGRWQVSASAEGFAPADAAVDLSPAAGAPSLTLELEPTSGLELRLRLPSGAAPSTVHAALVNADGRPVLGGTYQADSEGRIHLDAPAGTWRLLVSGPGTATLETPVTAPGLEGPFSLPAGGTLDVELANPPRPDLLARLSVEGPDGHPAPVVDLGGRLATEYPVVRGRATIDGLPPGGWTVHAVAQDGSRWSARATVVPGTVTPLVLEPEAHRP